jgi:Retrotransposon gag protein
MEVDSQLTAIQLQQRQVEMARQINELLELLANKPAPAARSSVEKPEPFKGKTDDSRRFLRYFTNWAIHQRDLLSAKGGRDDRRWISSALSFFTGDAYGWASRFLQEIVDAEIASSSGDAAKIASHPFPFTGNWEKFVQDFEKRFQPNDDKRSALLELEGLRQGNDIQSAHKLVTKFQEVFPRTGLSEQDAIVRLTNKLHTDDQMWLLTNQLGSAEEPKTLDELCARIINNEFTMRTRPAQMKKGTSSYSSPPAFTSAPVDPYAMQVDASRTPGRSRDEFTRVMQGRCYGCGLKTHLKRDCQYKETQCSYCKRKGHIQGVCQDRFMGLERDRGLKPRTQRVRASNMEETFDACATFGAPAPATISASISAAPAAPATPASIAMPADLQTYQQNQLRILEQIAQLRKDF